MGLIIRIDVDRPFGKTPVWRHVLSRFASDFYFPAVRRFGYLQELVTVLNILNQKRARSYIFFRQCTLPSQRVMALIKEGNHEIGLHLEDSRSYESFTAERELLQRHIGHSVTSFSKHGSGGGKFGRRHYPSYEPENYIGWGRRAGMSLFLGNLEDPTLPPRREGKLVVFPAAFWLEPHWRDTGRFSVEWLMRESTSRDIVLLIHPENVLENRDLTNDFIALVTNVATTILEPVVACN